MENHIKLRGNQVVGPVIQYANPVINDEGEITIAVTVIVNQETDESETNQRGNRKRVKKSLIAIMYFIRICR